MCCRLLPVGLESFVKVNINVQDINDNKPELAVDELHVCENDITDTVRKTCCKQFTTWLFVTSAFN